MSLDNSVATTHLAKGKLLLGSTLYLHVHCTSIVSFRGRVHEDLLNGGLRSIEKEGRQAKGEGGSCVCSVGSNSSSSSA